VLAGIRRQTETMIVWATFEQPVHPALGIADAQTPQGQGACIAELNRLLLAAVSAQRSAYVLDLNACLARLGAYRFYAARYGPRGRAPYAREAREEIAHELFKFLRARAGKARKCLVLDCDNVLWGGIIGEDGIAGIQLGRTHQRAA